MRNKKRKSIIRYKRFVIKDNLRLYVPIELGNVGYLKTF